MNNKLRTLAVELAKICWEGGSLDGGELQDMLVEAGVLTGVVVNQPCGENCRCRDYDVEPPWICYRLTEEVERAQARRDPRQTSIKPAP